MKTYSKAELDVMLAASDPAQTLMGAMLDFSRSLEALKELGDEEKYRSRELSLAITNIEQGILWLSAAAAAKLEAHLNEEPTR